MAAHSPLARFRRGLPPIRYIACALLATAPLCAVVSAQEYRATHLQSRQHRTLLPADLDLAAFSAYELGEVAESAADTSFVEEGYRDGELYSVVEHLNPRANAEEWRTRVVQRTEQRGGERLSITEDGAVALRRPLDPEERMARDEQLALVRSGAYTPYLPTLVGDLDALAEEAAAEGYALERLGRAPQSGKPAGASAVLYLGNAHHTVVVDTLARTESVSVYEGGDPARLARHTLTEYAGAPGGRGLVPARRVTTRPDTLHGGAVVYRAIVERFWDYRYAAADAIASAGTPRSTRHLSAFPNPVIGSEVYLSLPPSGNGEYLLTVSDAAGHTRLTREYFGAAGDFIGVDLPPDLPPGLYGVTLRDVGAELTYAASLVIR